METIEQYLSLLKELNAIEVRINRLATIFTQNGRSELDDLLIAGIINKSTQLSEAAQVLTTIEQYIPPTDNPEIPDINATDGT